MFILNTAANVGHIKLNFINHYLHLLGLNVFMQTDYALDSVFGNSAGCTPKNDLRFGMVYSFVCDLTLF